MGAPLSLSGGGTHRGGRDGMAPHPSYATEHGAVWSRTVEGCFCRELLEAGVDEPIELSEAELLKAAVVGEQLEAH